MSNSRPIVLLVDDDYLVLDFWRQIYVSIQTVQSALLVTCESLRAAESTIRQQGQRVQLCICDFFVGKDYALDLVDLLREHNPEARLVIRAGEGVKLSSENAHVFDVDRVLSKSMGAEALAEFLLCELKFLGTPHQRNYDPPEDRRRRTPPQDEALESLAETTAASVLA